MENQSEAILLRIFISSTDKFKHKPLYEVIVFAAKRYGLAGATVIVSGTMAKCFPKHQTVLIDHGIVAYIPFLFLVL